MQLPMGIFEAGPIWGKKIVSIEVQPESEDMLSIIVSGATWNWKGKLDAHGVAGAYFEQNGEKNYFRVLRSVDVSEDDGREKILQMLGERVFQGLAVRVVVAEGSDEALEEGTAVHGFIETLKERPSCHFK